MAGPGQPETPQPDKKVDLKATIEKLRAARERLEESRRLFIHKAHLPEPVASSAELELPEVAQRMVGALASKLEKTHSMVYHWNSWTPPTGQAKAKPFCPAGAVPMTTPIYSSTQSPRCP